MDDGRFGAMQPVHAQGNILQHSDLLQQGDVDLGVVQQVMEGSTGEEFRYDGKMTRLGAGAHKQDNVGVSEMTWVEKAIVKATRAPLVYI